MSLCLTDLWLDISTHIRSCLVLSCSHATSIHLHPRHVHFRLRLTGDWHLMLRWWSHTCWTACYGNWRVLSWNNQRNSQKLSKLFIKLSPLNSCSLLAAWLEMLTRVLLFCRWQAIFMTCRQQICLQLWSDFYWNHKKRGESSHSIILWFLNLFSTLLWQIHLKRKTLCNLYHLHVLQCNSDL